MEPIIIFISLCATIFGISYYHLFTRNKERMALIEAGADASLFQAAPNKKRHPAYSIALVLGLMFMGIGLGIFMATILEHMMGASRKSSEVFYFTGIFFFGGLGLLSSFLTLRMLDKKDEK